MGQLIRSKLYERKGETRLANFNRMIAEIKILAK